MADYPLYPSKDKEVRLINIYEPKPCMRCGKYGKDVEWRHVVTTSSKWIATGTEFDTEFTRICDSCFNQSEFIWG